MSILSRESIEVRESTRVVLGDIIDIQEKGVGGWCGAVLF